MGIDHLLFWHWWVLGFGLLILEMVVPTGFVLLFMGIAAIVVGLVTWIVPFAWELQLVAFGVLSIVAFFAFRKLAPQRPSHEQPTLNRRADSYVGRTFTLTRPLQNGIGEVRIDDSQWRIAGPDMPEGSQIRVVRADGATLKVERVV